MLNVKTLSPYRFNNSAEFGSKAWTWLHSCNDQNIAVWEGETLPGIVTKPCNCYPADAIEDQTTGLSLVAVTYWSLAAIRELGETIEPVITRNTDRMIYSLSDRQQWVDPTTLPGGGNNLEDNVLMREFQREVQQLLGY